MGLYMDIRPEITIDTEDYEASKKLINDLHKHFYKLLDPNSANNVGSNKVANKVGSWMAKQIDNESNFRPEEVLSDLELDEVAESIR
jgi:hypothetical protein